MAQPPKTPGRRERKREQMADLLADTAWQLFETHGFAAVTMEQVAQAADVAKGTLYNHFAVKEALVAHRFRVDIAEGMSERAAALAAQPTFEARMRYLLRESAEWHAARKQYMPQYLRYLSSQVRFGEDAKGQPPVDQGGRQILAAMFAAGQQAGEVDERHSAADLARSLEALLYSAMGAWLRDPNPDLTTRFLDALDLTLHGIARKPEAAPKRTNQYRGKS